MSDLEHIKPIARRVPKKVRKHVMSPPEDAEQQTVIDWARKYGHGAEQLHMMPNGSCFRRDNFALWNWLMSMGFQPGKPDLYLDIPRGTYHGLRIEMKRKDYKPADNPQENRQRECQQRLRDEGYKVVVACGAQEAIDTIKEYLNG